MMVVKSTSQREVSRQTKFGIVLICLAIVGALFENAYETIADWHRCPPLMVSLPRTYTVLIGRSGNSRSWQQLADDGVNTNGSEFGTPDWRLDQFSNPNTLAWLRHSDHHHDRPSTGIRNGGNIVLRIGSRAMGLYAYNYYCYLPATGEVGRGQDWVVTPPAFRQTMTSLIEKMSPCPVDRCQVIVMHTSLGESKGPRHPVSADVP